MWKAIIPPFVTLPRAKANPSPDVLLQCAHIFFNKYTVPQPQSAHMDAKVPPKDLETRKTKPTQAPDTVYNNTMLLTHDLLYDGTSHCYFLG